MLELSPEYLNTIADQLIIISSLLCGFSIAVIANFLVSKPENRISNTIFKASTVSAGSFLITVFAMTKIIMVTTEGYPLKITNGDLDLPKIIGFLSFFIGLTSLCVIIALSGWTRSKKTGVFTTLIGIITFLMILLNL